MKDIFELFDAQKQKSILFDSAEKAASMGAGIAAERYPDEGNIANKTFDSLYHIGASGEFSIKRITVL